MVRRFYICGGNNVGDPPVGAATIVDSYFIDKTVTGVFKEGFRYYEPGVEWSITASAIPGEYDTINILNGTLFQRDEVFIVEVSSLKIGAGAACGDQPEVFPYLPDILKCVVARVNTAFEMADEDPFSVYYSKGIYSQAGNDRRIADEGFIMIWLIMPIIIQEPKDDSYFGDAICDLLIAANTDASYSQQQREDINFHPRLIPVYQQFKYELKREEKLANDQITCGQMLLPYWGGGDVAAPGQNNLWKYNADCIKITGLKLKIKKIKCCTFVSSF